jgi:hypothetical protein
VLITIYIPSFCLNFKQVWQSLSSKSSAKSHPEPAAWTTEPVPPGAAARVQLRSVPHQVGRLGVLRSRMTAGWPDETLVRIGGALKHPRGDADA